MRRQQAEMWLQQPMHRSEAAMPSGCGFPGALKSQRNSAYAEEHASMVDFTRTAMQQAMSRGGYGRQDGSDWNPPARMGGRSRAL
mmetsp:Transcript_8674/g.22584  ORF Transcript_8674/g.22584 Transcript_8674/m.22584 type:complete len:85 (+) Transcript_8674:1083-1337(+)